MSLDVNFDDLAVHFKKRIYGSRKGQIRLAVLQRDLKDCVPNLESGNLKVLDIGAGMAQMGVRLAGMGHQVLINDISENMLVLAKEEAHTLNVTNNISWNHGPFQNIKTNDYDLVLCHAVLEWLNQPEVLIQKLEELMTEHGLVSLMFYNFDALVLHNLIRGNFNKINNNDYSGMKGGLTPPNPLKMSWVEEKLNEHGFDVFYKSGVRVFSDYVGIKRGGNEQDSDVIDMELLFSNQDPFLKMGRYIHFMCKKMD